MVQKIEIMNKNIEIYVEIFKEHLSLTDGVKENVIDQKIIDETWLTFKYFNFITSFIIEPPLRINIETK